MKFQLGVNCVGRPLFFLASFMAAGVVFGDPVKPPAEGGYLDELPVVLSVTRLAQSLADTPGAVTIIDREMIRRSGAREITDILRLVPGFIVMRAPNGANPVAYYHAAFDENGRQMQVFIDGRSVYSSLYLGDTHRGLMGLVLEDIERVEILRGSNSAAYGANAYLGVINIMTRNAVDTRGALVSVTSGTQGVHDTVARFGWGNEDASFRLTTSRRSDNGMNAFREPQNTTSINPAFDDKNISQVHFRGDMRPSVQDEVSVSAGHTSTTLGIGVGTSGNPSRMETIRTAYAQGRWTRQLSQDESIALSASLDSEDYREDRLVAVPLAVVMFGTSGKSERHNLEFSHTMQPSETVRSIWGVNWRRESVTSPMLFNRSEAQRQQQLRLFGNVEWRPASQWVVNAGGLFEHNSDVSSGFSPRLMVNYQVTPDQTIRAGITKARRTPTLFERRANQSIYHPLTGAVLFTGIVSSGKVKPEQINSREIGYLGEFRPLALSLDVRVFDERLTDTTTIPSGAVRDFSNMSPINIRGLEQQWRWKPSEATHLLFSHAHIDIHSENFENTFKAPQTSYSLAWLQKLPGNWDFSLMYARVGQMAYTTSPSAQLPVFGQIDARLAYPFRIGSTRAEVSITTQALNGSHLEYKNSVLVSRRTFATLRLEF